MAFSSTSSSKTPTTTKKYVFNRCGSETCYFPNCRRDANCNCEICMESFNATKDLHSALTFPTKKSRRRILNSSPPSTLDSVSSISTFDHSQPLISTVNSQHKKRLKKRNKKNDFSIMGYFVSCLLFAGVLLSLMVSFGCLERFGPKLKYEIARGFIEDISSLDGGVRLKLESLEKKLNGMVGINGRVRKCSFMDSIWKLNQDEGNRLLYQWKCVLYKSLAEELSVWGSPLQTFGFLMTRFSSRSLTLLSGNITEVTNWSQGKLVPILRGSNKRSWKLLKFTSAAVQLENETWVLEYSRNALWDNPGLIQNIWMILKESGKQMPAMWLKLKHTVSNVFEGSYYSNWKCKQIVTPT